MGFHVSEHCSAAPMGNASFSVSFQLTLWPSVMHGVGISLPVYWSVV